MGKEISPRMNLLKRAGVGLGAAAAIGALASCTNESSKENRGTNPSIGTAGETLAVKIDNVRAARPSTGVQHAQTIYVEQVEGGLTRLLAVFGSDNLPSVVGPVRSARETDLDLLSQYGKPVFAYSGARSALLPEIGKANLFNLSHDNAGQYYTRHNDRHSPHNLYLDPKELLTEANATELTVSKGGTPANGVADSSVSVRFPAAEYQFTWTGSRYNVSMDGSPARNTDTGQSHAETVIVQHVRLANPVYGAPTSPYAQSIGSGKAEFYRDGKRFDAKWNRPNDASKTDYTSNGKQIDFATGQTWVLLVQ